MIGQVFLQVDGLFAADRDHVVIAKIGPDAARGDRALASACAIVMSANRMNAGEPEGGCPCS